jgi:hypothetical protein
MISILQCQEDTDMRMPERSIEVIAPESTPTTGVTQRPQKHWIILLRSPLWLCLLLALAIRVWLVVHTHGTIDGDEALVGIQAEHILRGELPIYFYGQPYLGSLEAYLIALMFAIAGPSAWSLRAEPILLSLVLVWLTWKLAAALADAAQLPTYGKRTFMTIAALLAAIPPLYDGVIELRTFGGFIETFILMLLLLLSTLQLTRRWQSGASQRELALRWAGIGFIVGLGFWIYPLIISAVLAAAIWIVCYCIAAITKSKRQNSSILRRSVITSLAGLLPAIAAIPTSLIGFAPALYWGATHQWQNIAYVLGLGGGTSIDRLGIIRKVTRLYLSCVAPRVIGGAIPKEGALLTTLHSPLLIIGILCIAATVVLVALSFLSPHPSLLRIRQLGALPLLFAASTAFIFCLSTVSASGLLSTCDADFAGRYATPLLLALPFFFATIFTAINLYIHEKSERVGAVAPRFIVGEPAERVSIPRPSPIMNFNKQDRQWVVTLSPSLRSRVNSAKGLFRWAARCFASLSMTMSALVVKLHYRPQGNLIITPWGRVPAQAGFFEHGNNGDDGDIGDIGDKCPNGDIGDIGDKSRSTRAPSLGDTYPPHPTSLRPYEHDNLLPKNLPLRGGRVGYTVLQTILFAFLSVYLGAHVATYGLTDTAATFQSPFCLEAPANNDPIISYLQHKHIRYAWAANLLAYPIVFKTNGSIIIANPLALTKPPLAINRIPAYTAAVQHADRPSILIFAQHNDPHPALLTMLDKQQVTYQVARFPSEPGIDVLVVTPLNRTVSPFASNAFNGFFICGE